MKRLLVVEDDEDTRLTVVDILSMQLRDLEIVEARDGFEARDALEHERFDGVVLDHRLPRMTGSELVAWARRSGLDIPFVLVSAAHDLDALADRLGIDCYLGKPFGLDQLVSLVRRAIVDGEC